MKSKDTNFGSKAPANLTPQDCLPPELQKFLNMEAWDDLCALGIENLQDCIRYYRGEIRTLDKRIAWEEGIRKFFLRHQTTQAILEFASKFSGLKHCYGSRYSEQTMTPVPMDEDDLKRGEESSTLNVCGWCKFCQTGWHHATSACKLSGSCGLMPEYHDPGRKPMDLCRFDRKCTFVELTKEEPLLLMRCFTDNHKRLMALERERLQLRERIRQLRLAQDLAESKPTFPQCRRDDYSKVGDRVRLMLPRTEDLYVSRGVVLAPIRSGKVVLGSGENDSILEGLPNCASAREVRAFIATNLMMSGGYVKIRLDVPPDETSTIWDTCVHHSFILSEEDFRRLRRDSEYRILWLEAVRDLRSIWIYDSWRAILSEYDSIA